MGKIYEVTLRCTSVALANILGAIDGEAELMGVAPVPEPPSANGTDVSTGETAPPAWKTNEGGNGHATPPSSKGKGTGNYYAGGKRNKGISGYALLLQVLAEADRTYSYSEIVNRFKAHGFAESSPSPLIYRAIKEGKIRNCGGSMYQLANRPA